jgi:hypothetical protein
MGFISFAVHKLQLPIVVFWDLLHQGVNDVTISLQRAGFWPALLELLLVFRLPYGPWAGQKFWRDLQDASKLAAAAGLASSSYFESWLGERLERETSGRACSSNFRESDQPLFDDVWDKKGVRATLGRWFSWWHANQSLRKVWWSKLASLVFALAMAGKLPPASLFQSLQTKAVQAGFDLASAEAARQAKKKTAPEKNNVNQTRPSPRRLSHSRPSQRQAPQLQKTGKGLRNKSTP